MVFVVQVWGLKCTIYDLQFMIHGLQFKVYDLSIQGLALGLQFIIWNNTIVYFILFGFMVKCLGFGFIAGCLGFQFGFAVQGNIIKHFALFNLVIVNKQNMKITYEYTLKI